MLKARNGKDGGIILEFKVLDSDKEDSLQDTVKKRCGRLSIRAMLLCCRKRGSIWNRSVFMGLRLAGRAHLLMGDVSWIKTYKKQKACRFYTRFGIIA